MASLHVSRPSGKPGQLHKEHHVRLVCRWRRWPCICWRWRYRQAGWVSSRPCAAMAPSDHLRRWARASGGGRAHQCDVAARLPGRATNSGACTKATKCWCGQWHRRTLRDQVANRADGTRCITFVRPAGGTDAAPVQLERGAPWRAPRRNRLALCFPGFQVAGWCWCSIWCNAAMNSEFLRIKAGAAYH